MPSPCLLPLTVRKDSRREHWHPLPDNICPAERALFAWRSHHREVLS
jgi:hypothetical protein